MIDNEFAYELTPEQVEFFDMVRAKALITLRNEAKSNTVILASNNEYLSELDEKLMGIVSSVSLFRLFSKDGVAKAHTDSNKLASPTRRSALNFVVSGDVNVEWWSANEPETVMYPHHPGYACDYFPLGPVNDLRFTLQLDHSKATLVETEVPHLGYSNPEGGLLVSIGFFETFADMKALIKSL